MKGEQAGHAHSQWDRQKIAQRCPTNPKSSVQACLPEGGHWAQNFHLYPMHLPSHWQNQWPLQAIPIVTALSKAIKAEKPRRGG